MGGFSEFTVVISRDLRLFSPAKLAATRNAVKTNLQLLDVNPDDLQSMHTAFKKFDYRWKEIDMGLHSRQVEQAYHFSKLKPPGIKIKA